MAIERWCMIRFETIRNTTLVDPETQEGQDYLDIMRADDWVMLPEAEAQAQYPYWTPPS